jgi:hypothetical protein
MLNGVFSNPIAELSSFSFSRATADSDDTQAGDTAAGPIIEIGTLTTDTAPIVVSGAGENLPVRFYTIGDLALFERLTGYRLVMQGRVLRAVDQAGNRATADDRLFTVLAEEAFQLADRQRRSGSTPDADLTVDDLAGTFGSIRRAAAAIGARGLLAFERLETVVARPENASAPAPE